MNTERSDTGAATGQSWVDSLYDLEESLQAAARALSALRRELERGGRAGGARDEPRSSSPPGTPAALPVGEGRGGRAQLGAFDRLWDRMEQQRLAAEEGREQMERRGLAALPHQFLMTVEDRAGKVDLVPLHRALLGLRGVEEMALVSYANGVPVVSLRLEGDLDPDALSAAVGTAMDRECEVIQQGNGRLYLRLQAKER